MLALWSLPQAHALASTGPPAPSPAGPDCRERRLEAPPHLSIKGKEKAQFRALVRAVEDHAGIEMDGRLLAREFTSCLDDFRTLMEGKKAGRDAEPRASRWVETAAGLDVRVSEGATRLDIRHEARKASFKIGKHDHGPRLASRVDGWLANASPDSHRESLRRLAWYLWVEGLLSMLNETHSVYIYADELVVDRALSDGRSFRPGFRPRFEQDRLLVAGIQDQDLVRQGLEVGVEIQELNGREFSRWSRRELQELWFSPRPFRYFVRTASRSDQRQITGVSIPYRHQTLWWDLLRGSGYARISGFSRETLIELRRALREMRAAQVNGLVLDLRGNRGGRVSHGLVDCFLKPDQIVISYQDMADDGERVDVPGTVEYFGAPLVVLVDSRTASMAEMLAASLKANERATLIGTRTRGKAVAQSVRPVRGEGELHLVSTRYFYPGTNESWNGTGIEPHLTIQLTPDEEENLAELLQEPALDLEAQIDLDPALRQALELLEPEP